MIPLICCAELTKFHIMVCHSTEGISYALCVHYNVTLVSYQFRIKKFYLYW